MANKTHDKRVYIKTYGCQMNVYDSDRMLDILNKEGYKKVEFPEGADLIILNTCHIREKATEKLFSDLGRVRVFKQAKEAHGGHTLIAVTGCVAQAEGEEIPRRAPYVDIVVGPQSYHELPQMLQEAFKNKEEALLKGEKQKAVVNTNFPLESKFDHLPAPNAMEGYASFLSIQEGCDKFCTFCVVPYTRGAEFSRPVNDVVREAEELINQGVKEITLLGQNVTAYHGIGPDGKKEWNMASLILRLADIEGLERIRYTTSHPRDIDHDLIAVHGSCEKLMPFLHLPVQSGSNKILEAMNRKHTRERYFEIIESLRTARPDLALSTDIIVGFPGETDQDFEETMDLVRRVTFAQTYSFKYSKRPGTPAANQEEQVEETVKDMRLQALQALLREQQIAFNRSKIGDTLPVLFEKLGRHPGQYIGRTPYLQAIHASASDDIRGKLLMVEVKKILSNSLEGSLL